MASAVPALRPPSRHPHVLQAVGQINAVVRCKGDTAGIDLLDVGSIAKDYELRDAVVANGEVEGKNERIRQTTFIELAVHLSRSNEVAIVIDQVRDLRCQALAEYVPFSPSPVFCLSQ